jgi:ParB-like chromosome segregation protein Spo0J
MTRKVGDVKKLTHTEFKIDPEFQAMMVPLSDHQRTQLEANLLKNKNCDPLTVWKEEGVLLDGHNRYEICERLGIPYTIKEISLPDRPAAVAWIRENQVGRRNLMPEGLSYLRGKHYHDAKQEHGGVHDTKTKDGKKTEEVLAALYKTSPKTIRNDAKFAAALDKMVEVDKVHEQFKIAVLQREVKITRGQVVRLSKMDEKEQYRIAEEAVKTGKWPKKMVEKKAKTITLPRAPGELAKRLLGVQGAGYVRKLQVALTKALAGQEEGAQKKGQKA